MRGFMEGLLKTLKAENTGLRQRYEPAPEGGPLASVREDRGEGALDEFLALEAEAEEAGEAGEAEGGVSSPLREARMHAWEVVEEAGALDWGACRVGGVPFPHRPSAVGRRLSPIRFGTIK